jgi:hypothetical protein
MQTPVAAVLQDGPCRPSTPTGSSLHITWESRSCSSPRPAARLGAARRAAHLPACCPAARLRWLWEYADAGRGTNGSDHAGHGLGWADRSRSAPRFYLLAEAPHDWLFPQMAAVVHHGGAGTTAAGLRAGRPTVICPFLGDQPFWGTLVHACGVGPQPIPQRQLTVPRLTAAIDAAVNDPLMRQRAAVLSAHMQAEDGVARAVAIIEQVVRRSDGVRQSANVPARGATAR